MTNDDLLFRHRVKLFARAREVGVTQACREFGYHRSSYYRLRHQVLRQGLEMLRPRDRRRPRMPNQVPPWLEERMIAFALGHPGLGLRRIAAQLRQLMWSGLVISPSGVYNVLSRHGSLPAIWRPMCRGSSSNSIASTSAGSPAPRGGSGSTPPSTWPAPSPGPRSTSLPSTPLPATPQCWCAGWPPSWLPPAGGCRASPPTTARSSAPRSSAGCGHHRGAHHRFIHAGRAQSNGCVERVQRTHLDGCWRPSFARSLVPKVTALQRDLVEYLDSYIFERAHTGIHNRGLTPAALVYGARKMRPR